MIETTRTITASIEGETELSEMKRRFYKAVDEAFLSDVSEVKFIAAENAEVAPGHLQIEVTAPPEAMMIEAKWFLKAEFDHVSTTVVPTDEEIEAMQKSQLA